MSKYIVEMIPLRRNIHDTCRELFNNENLAEMIYMNIMIPLEDFLCDECEEYKDER